MGQTSYLKQYQCADNYIYKYKFENNGNPSKFVIKNFVAEDSLDSIRNLFGSKRTNIGENLYKKFMQYENMIKNPKTSKELDFIPVVASSQTKAKLDEGAKKGLIIKKIEKGVETYLVAKTAKTIHTYGISGSTSHELLGFSSTLVKLGVVDTFFTGIDMGLITSRDFVNSYYKYYLYHNFEGQVTDYKEKQTNEIVYDDKNKCIIQYEHSKDPKKHGAIIYYVQLKVINDSNERVVCGLEQHFESDLNTLITSKNMPLDATPEMLKKHVFSIASVGIRDWQIKGLKFKNQDR